MFGDNPLFRIVDKVTRKPVSIASFLSRESAQQTLDSWLRRQARGGRPDVDVSGCEVAPSAETEA